METSLFGAEFVVMKNGMESLRGLQYKLRIMAVLLSGLSFAYGDNMSVIRNNQRPKSVLKKKYNSIFYHGCRECTAMDEIVTGHVRSKNSPANLATKVLGGSANHDGLISHLFHYLT